MENSTKVLNFDDAIFDKLYFSFEEEYRACNGTQAVPSSWEFNEWLAINAGIVNDSDNSFWKYFYVVDHNLFMMAMLRYSA